MFDLDGTLVDSAPTMVLALNTVFGRHGFAVAPASQILSQIGRPLEKLIGELVPPGADVVALSAEYRAAYEPAADQAEQMFEGIAEVLDLLAATGSKMVIATGKSQFGADGATRRFQLQRWFSLILGGDSVPRGKPHPDLLERVLRETGCAASDAIVIGDTTFDLRMAHSAGVESCAVTWGNHGETRLLAENPTYLVREVSKMGALLVGLC